MKVLIVGAGAVGRSVARELAHSASDVTIIDQMPAAMKVSSVAEADWILGDACELPTLERAGADSADVLVAATGDDKANLVVSLLAKTEFGIPRTVARINNPLNEWLFDDTWGVDVAVSTPRMMTALVEDAMADGELVDVMTFQLSGATLLQATLPDDAPVVGMSIAEIVLPPTIVINAIIRDGVPFTPEGDLTVDGGDQLLFLAAKDSHHDIDDIRPLFKSVPEDDEGAEERSHLDS
ncbi:MAG: TrkA family potassium uptake protein [Actinomycetaceae bacterium]|nr:TrkA family potassium uptake protein [Actinomycetaceae bacterium]MDY6083095.1 TrkA family potassium uptake protein [Actinomycetaceae bacterium]